MLFFIPHLPVFFFFLFLICRGFFSLEFLFLFAWSPIEMMRSITATLTAETSAGLFSLGWSLEFEVPVSMRANQQNSCVNASFWLAKWGYQIQSSKKKKKKKKTHQVPKIFVVLFILAFIWRAKIDFPILLNCWKTETLVKNYSGLLNRLYT